MRNWKKKVVTCGLVTVMTMASAARIFAAVDGGRVDPINVPGNDSGVYYELPEDANQSMEEFVKGLSMLTEKEKMQLVEDDKAAAPYYQKLEYLENKIEEKTRVILKKAAPYFDERGKLFDAHTELWDKMWDNMTEEQKGLRDYIVIIKASKVLSAKEKAILIKEQNRIEELEKKIDQYYAKAEKATADLRKQVEENTKKINEIHDKSAAIWEKVYGSRN